MRDVAEGLALVASGFATSFVLWKIADVLLRMGVETHLYMMFGMALAVLIGLAEASTLVIPYYRISQRLTHGSARWADVPALKGLGLAHDNRLPLPAGALRLGRLTHRYDLALPFEKPTRGCQAAGTSCLRAEETPNSPTKSRPSWWASISTNTTTAILSGLRPKRR